MLLFTRYLHFIFKSKRRINNLVKLFLGPLSILCVFNDFLSVYTYISSLMQKYLLNYAQLLKLSLSLS